MYFKKLHEIVDIPSGTLFQARDIRTRSNGLTHCKEKLNCNKRYIFLNRCLNIWNMLPQNVVSWCSFKNRLNSLEINSIILKASHMLLIQIIKIALFVFRHTYF